MPSLSALSTYSGAVAFIHIALPAPSRMGRTARTTRSVQTRSAGFILGFVPIEEESVCLLCDCGHAVCLVILR